MNENVKHVMDRGAFWAAYIQRRGHMTVGIIMRQMVQTIGSLDQDLTRTREMNRILNKELTGLRAAATEQARIIRQLRKEAGYYG